ncbi:MAG: hypothetical protein IAF02_09515 [Anaerolineae bacterium]|nr:hypothetical protein [Anaerolineae bacterium]
MIQINGDPNGWQTAVSLSYTYHKANLGNRDYAIDNDQQNNLHLVTIRVWVEKDTDNQMQCRGKLHIPSGEIRYFVEPAASFPHSSVQ